MEPHDLLLKVGIGIGHALVLAQMLGPGFDHEPFQHLLRIGGILGDAPAIGTIAAAFLRQRIDRVQEAVAILGPQ